MRLEQLRAQREQQELKECTFQPETNPYVASRRSLQQHSNMRINRGVLKPHNGPVLIRGVGRFMELRELAKRQEAERKEREAKVFMMNPKGNPYVYTEPQPFHLHSDAEAEERKYRLMLEVPLCSPFLLFLYATLSAKSESNQITAKSNRCEQKNLPRHI